MGGHFLVGDLYPFFFCEGDFLICFKKEGFLNQYLGGRFVNSRGNLGGGVRRGTFLHFFARFRISEGAFLGGED